MTFTVWLMAGWLIGAGLWLIWLSSSVHHNQPDIRVTRGSAQVPQVVAAIIGAGILAAATAWPVACLFGALVGWIGPGVVAGARRRRREQAIDEALPTWLENVRGAVVSGTSIHRAVEDSIGVAKPVIQGEVIQLSRTIRTEDLRTGLRRFAASMKHPLVDVVVLALVLTDRHGGEREEVLDWVVRRLRRQTQARQEIAASRRKIYTQVVMVAMISFGIIVYLVVFSRAYLEPYDSMLGQVVLLVVGGLFSFAGLSLSGLAREKPEPRPFATEVGRPSRAVRGPEVRQ